MPRVRKVAFNLFASLSLIVLAILPLGYIGSFGLLLMHQPAPAVIRSVAVGLDRGRVEFWWRRQPPPALPFGLAARLPPGFQVRGEAKLRWPPEWRQAIWEFDAHVLPTSVLGPGGWMFLLACPIWCVAVVCLILPTIAWRRWRRRRQDVQPRGFDVSRPPAVTAPPA